MNKNSQLSNIEALTVGRKILSQLRGNQKKQKRLELRQQLGYKIPSQERLKRDYGITQKQWLTLKAKQNHKCAICKINLSQIKIITLDHDHKTGIIRGLLCNECNRSLGGFKDNIQLLQNAINYLQNKTIKCAQQQHPSSRKSKPNTALYQFLSYIKSSDDS
jgi:hypothetical protein